MKIRHAVFLLVAATPSAGRAADRESVLDAPAPPTLPALAHKSLTYTFEYTAAGIEPNEPSELGDASSLTTSYAWFAHQDLEMPIVPRKWYVGVAHDVATASVPGVGKAFFIGNPEIWARGIWSSTRGLSSGGGLGFVLPTPRSLSEDESTVQRTVRVVRPWDAAYFTDLTLTFRPWFDIRHVTGRFILQFRQGIDWSVPLTQVATSGLGSSLTARATFYVGFRAARFLGVGLELWEVYELTSPKVPDNKRAAFTISPSIRFVLPRVEPAISVLVPIATPLRGDVASYYAARFNVGFDFDFPPSPPGR
jgi:hypothetical protein